MLDLIDPLIPMSSFSLPALIGKSFGQPAKWRTRAIGPTIGEIITEGLLTVEITETMVTTLAVVTMKPIIEETLAMVAAVAVAAVAVVGVGAGTDAVMKATIRTPAVVVVQTDVK